MLRRALPAVAVVAVAVAALAGMAPWHRSGSVERSGLAIVGSAERLGLVGSGLPAVTVATWRVLPVLAVLAVVARGLGRPALAAAVAVAGGVVAVAVGWVVLGAPGAQVSGPWTSVAAGLVAVMAGSAGLVVIAVERGVGLGRVGPS